MILQPKIPPMQPPKNQRLQGISNPSSVACGFETDVVTGMMYSGSVVVVASPFPVDEAWVVTSLSWLVIWPSEFVDGGAVPVSVGSELGFVLTPEAVVSPVVEGRDVPESVGEADVS